MLKNLALFLTLLVAPFVSAEEAVAVDNNEVQIMFRNRVEQTVDLYYIDENSERKKVDTLEHEQTSVHTTYIGDVFIAVGKEKEEEFGPFRVMFDREEKVIYDTNHDDSVEVEINNHLTVPISVYWYVPPSPEMAPIGPAIEPGKSIRQTAWVGHIFVAKTEDGIDVGEVMMEEKFQVFNVGEEPADDEE